MSGSYGPTREHDAGWTDERVAILRQLWPEISISAAEIAERLGGGVTRNAVIGKATRLKLLSRKTIISRQRSNENKRRKARERGIHIRLLRALGVSEPKIPNAAGDMKRLKGPAWDALPGSLPATLEFASGCRWPIGVTAPYTFCDMPAEGTYCSEHQKMSVRTSREQKHRDELWMERGFLPATREAGVDSASNSDGSNRLATKPAAAQEAGPGNSVLPSSTRALGAPA